MIIDKLKHKYNLTIDKTMFDLKVKDYKIGKHFVKLNVCLFECFSYQRNK